MDVPLHEARGTPKTGGALRASWLRRFLDWLIAPEHGQFKDRRTNAWYLLLYLALLTLPALFVVDHDGKSISLANRSLPPTCFSHQLFGVSCPGCGLGRSFVAVTHGHFSAAMAFHRISIPLYALFLGQVVLRAWCLWRGARPLPRGVVLIHHWAALGMIALLIGNWVVGGWFGGNGL